MADNSSNSVAIVAIIIILLVAAGGFYYFMNHGGLRGDTSAPTKVEVNMPSTNGNAAQ